nr:hypothetical protein [uncultured Desulfobacter sp.]
MTGTHTDKGIERTHMKYSLKAKWFSPDNSSFSPKQTSIRLPILSAAKIDALCAMFPSMTKSSIINDLIIEALESFATELETEPGNTRGYKNLSDENISEKALFEKLTQQYLGVHSENIEELEE